MDELGNSSDNLQSTDIEGWSVEADEDQKQAEAKENAKLISSIGVIQDVMTWLEIKRKAYEGIEIIANAGVSSKAEDIKSAVLLNQQMLYEMKNLLRDFRVEYSKYITERPID